MYGAAKDEGSFIYGTLYTEWMVKNNQSMVKQNTDPQMIIVALICIDNIPQSRYIRNDKNVNPKDKGPSGSEDAEGPKLLFSVKDWFVHFIGTRLPEARSGANIDENGKNAC